VVEPALDTPGGYIFHDRGSKVANSAINDP
jgi:hypothetical protein